MGTNVHKTEFSDAAMLGCSLSQASVSDPKKYQHRHRANVRARFLKGGSEAIADFELLELIIFRAISCQDVRPVCKLLLQQFGTFNNVITASEIDLKNIKGVGQAVINELKIVQAAAHKMAQLQVLDKDVLTTWDQLISYCRSKMAHLQYEQFHALFLDILRRLN